MLNADRTFEELGRHWFARRVRGWIKSHAVDVLHSLETDVFPHIGHMLAKDITTPIVLRALRLVEDRGALETARRIRQRISEIFCLGIAEGELTGDPAHVVRKAMETNIQTKRHPAARQISEARSVIAAIENCPARPGTKRASLFLAMTAARWGMVRSATWAEIEGVDWSGEGRHSSPLWRVPAARMKLIVARKADSDYDHVIPLAEQACEMLVEIYRESPTPDWIFRGKTGKTRIGANSLSECYREAGLTGKHVPHGWRAAFSTVMNERHRVDRAVIDQALAHVSKDKVEAAYNRADHMGRRRELLQEWADLLLGDDDAWRDARDRLRAFRGGMGRAKEMEMNGARISAADIDLIVRRLDRTAAA